MARKSSERDMLKTVYMFVVNNWAVTTADIVSGVDSKIPTERLLKKLRRSSLLDATHVNGEKALTWQSMYDIENSDVNETLASAERDFNAAFPAEVAEVKTGRSGATGPRYSDAQIKKGLAAKAAGKSRKEVAEAAGVKSPNYFNSVLVKAGADDRPVEKATTKEEIAAASKAKTRSAGRRGRRNTGGGSTRKAKS